VVEGGVVVITALACVDSLAVESDIAVEGSLVEIVTDIIDVLDIEGGMLEVVTGEFAVELNRDSVRDDVKTGPGLAVVVSLPPSSEDGKFAGVEEVGGVAEVLVTGIIEMKSGSLVSLAIFTLFAALFLVSTTRFLAGTISLPVHCISSQRTSRT
jgi:hypothetical protein